MKYIFAVYDRDYDDICGVPILDESPTDAFLTISKAVKGKDLLYADSLCVSVLGIYNTDEDYINFFSSPEIICSLEEIKDVTITPRILHRIFDILENMIRELI